MYPHSVTAILAAKDGETIRRNQVLLPAYSVLLSLIALMGLMALAAGLNPATPNLAVPLLMEWALPPWFAGFCYAAVAIGALVPAAIMSIASANLFTRNLYREYWRKDATPKQESQVAKLVSLVVKLGALAFILLLPQQYAIDLQLLGGAWILQTLPAIVFGLWRRHFHHSALLAGWASGMAASTAMEISLNMKGSIYPLHLFGHTYPAYAACYALALNLGITAALSLCLDAFRVARHADATMDSDYEDRDPRWGMAKSTVESCAMPHLPGKVSRWPYILLLIPFVALLLPGTYARMEPMLLGFPFFYWYQILWVALGAMLTGTVFWLQRGTAKGCGPQ
jgi:SSS family solute:Na+ symporter